MVWLGLGFILLGAVACVTILNVGERLSHFGGGIAGFVVVILFLPGVWLCIVGLKKAKVAFDEMRPHLHWWHGLWLLAYISSLVFRIRDAPELRAEPIDAWALLRLGPEMIVAFSLLTRLVLRRPYWLGSLSRGLIGVLALYACICAASTMWSVYPSWTLYHGLEYLMDIVVLATILEVITSTESYEILMDFTWLIFGVSLFVVWVEALIAPSLAFDEDTHRMQGLFPIEGFNSIGTGAAVLAIVATARLLRIDGRKSNRAWYLTLLGFSLVTMAAAQTRNAIAGFLCGALLVLICSKRVWLVSFFSAIALPILTSSALRAYFERGQKQVNIESLSGRMDFWQFAWDLLTRHPLTGLGAYAGGRFAVLAVLGRGDTSTLHNDYLEVAIGTSFWGLIPFLIALGGTWWVLLRSVRNTTLEPHERQLALEGIGVIGVLTLHSFFNTDMSWHAPLIYLTILGYAEFLRRSQKKRVARRHIWNERAAHPPSGASMIRVLP